MDATSPVAVAQSAVRRFARLTNLVLASTPVSVLGAGPVAEELTVILRRIGAQLIAVDDQVPPIVQLLIITDSHLSLPEIVPGERPLVLLGTEDDLGPEWFIALPEVPARPGIIGRRGPRDLFWLEYEA